MKYLFYIPVIFSLLISTTSCKKEKADQLGIQKDEPIEGNISAYMSPQVDYKTSNKQFSITCKTEKGYPCSNYPIKYSINTNGKNISINLEAVTIQTICATAFGPADCTIPLSHLKNGTYNLVFNVRDNANRYVLTITDESYHLKPVNSPKEVSFTNSELMKVPDNIAWGYMWNHDGSNISSSFNLFDSTMRAKGAIAKTLSAGDYGYFKINANGKMFIDPHSNGISYVYTYADSIATLEPVIKQFPNSMSVRLSRINDRFISN